MLPAIHPEARRRPRTTLLVWHDIVLRDKLVWFDTTVAEFAAQLARLRAVGAQAVTLERVERWLRTGADPPPPGAVVLCFDDNTCGIYDFAFRTLRRLGWPFVVSAHTAYVGVRTGKAHNGWETLAEMAGGGATVVSQTVTHPPDLRNLSDAALADEMRRSRQTMTQRLGATPSFVTYPSGKWDQRVAQAAQAAGYALGLTEDFGAAERSPHRLGVHRYSTHRRFDEALRAIRRSVQKK